MNLNATRTALLLVGIVFTAYHSARTLFWTGPVMYPVLIIITVCIVALVTLIGLFAQSRTSPAAADAPLTAGGNGPSEPDAYRAKAARTEWQSRQTSQSRRPAWPG